MTIEELVASAREHGFEDAGAIRRLARRAWSLRPSRTVGRDLSRTRLGGLPDLPLSEPWPQSDGRSMAFIAQIGLSSGRAAPPDGFPSGGLLLFFYDTERATWGFDPKDAGSFAVIHVPESASAAVERDLPADLPEEVRFAPCDLVAEETATLPPWDGLLIEELDLDRGQLEAYQEVLEAISGEDAWAARGLLGGHPDQIQGDMMLECAMVSAGLYCGDATAYKDPRLPAFREQAHDWRLLLQVPSVEQAGMMWGDVGCLYYWIREEDLKACRFERAWMILQCG